MARPRLTGILLVGGASTRFGSPKALARLGDETLAERAWRVLGEACDERLAVGKRADGLELPFELVDDGTETRAALAGIVAGLRAAPTELAVVLPVDTPLVTAALLRDARRGLRRRRGHPDRAAAGRLPEDGPAGARAAARRRELALHEALAELETAQVEVDETPAHQREYAG